MARIETPREALVTTLAVLFGLLGLSNVTKPLSQALWPQSTAGFVFFGTRLHGSANAIVGPLFGAVLGAYAFGLWTRKRWVVPLAGGYAVYVIANLALFAAKTPLEETGGALGLFVYAAVAVGVSSGTATYLFLHRAELR